MLMSFALLTSNGKLFHKAGPAYLKGPVPGILLLHQRTSIRSALKDLSAR